VALVRVEHILHRNALVGHREGDLVGLGLFYARVVRALADEERRFDLIHVEQR